MSTAEYPPHPQSNAADQIHKQLLPELHVHTTSLDQWPGLAVTDAQQPLYWTHEDFELVGVGEPLTFEFSGASRFDDAKRVWQALLSRATIDDSVQVNGTGLIAFTSFAFDDFSESKSFLILPRTVLGRSGSVLWRTELSWVLGHPDAAAALAQVAAETADQLTHQIVPVGRKPLVHFEEPQFRAAEFTAAVARSTELISQGALEKVVLARDLRLQSSHLPDYRITLLSLAERYRDCWTFAVAGLIGSSPETLLELHHGAFQVRVLAGSAPRGEHRSDDAEQREALLNSAKNRQEHHYAVESALASLAEVVETLETGDTFCLQLPNLWHLATDIHGKLDEHTSPIDVIAALHPTAAVAGTPTPDALALIRELEPFDRGRYAGPVGWLSSAGDGQWAIALRSAQTTSEGSISAYAGCGIVANSNPEDELAETSLKFRPILDALGIREAASEH